MPKKAIILIEDHYNDLELWYPKIRLAEAGAEVLVAGPEEGKAYKSKFGMPCKADVSYDSVRPGDVDGLIVPGGYAPDLIRRHWAALDLVRSVFKLGKPVAHICHAGWVLISAGILDGYTSTSFFAIKDDMINAGVTWVDEPVVVDRNLVSSRTPDDLPQFMKAVIKMMGL